MTDPHEFVEVKQEIHYEATRDTDTIVPNMLLRIKQEIKDEIPAEMIGSDDFKINASCSMSVTGVETVSDDGFYEEVEKKYDKDESIFHTQCYLNNSHVDNREENMNSLHSFQHSQHVRHDTLSERLSEQIRNTVERTDVLVDFKTKTGHNGHIVKRTNGKKTPYVASHGEITQSQDKPYKCDNEGLVGRLKKHIRAYKVVKSYKCDFCGIEFTANCCLKIHKRTHKGNKIYMCDVCGVRFSEYSDLKTHKRTHIGKKPYTCDICGGEFSHSGHLKRHIRTHTGEKPYKCDTCGLEFSQNSSMAAHKRTHTGEKPHKCDICGLGFSQNGTLKRHKITHTGEKPYKCDVCGVGFGHDSTLKRHERTHTGEKPYKCDICFLGFSQSSTLKRHTRIHT